MQNEGKEIAYTVEEISIEYYNSTISGDMENGFVITNSCTYIDTGDGFEMVPWVAGLLLAGTGVGTIRVMSKRKEEEE